MATHPSVLAWRIPGMGEPWWAAVSGVAQSRTQLKRLSSSIQSYMKQLEQRAYGPQSQTYLLSDLLLIPDSFLFSP